MVRIQCRTGLVQIEVMTSSQCATTVHAIRDSELACLPAGLLDTIKLKQPQVSCGILGVCCITQCVCVPECVCIAVAIHCRCVYVCVCACVGGVSTDPHVGGEDFG